MSGTKLGVSQIDDTMVCEQGQGPEPPPAPPTVPELPSLRMRRRRPQTQAEAKRERETPHAAPLRMSLKLWTRVDKVAKKHGISRNAAIVAALMAGLPHVE